MSRSNCDDCPRVKALQAEVASLRSALDAATRAAKRQAAPFSKGEPKRNPKRPGRKPGKAYGRRAFRPRPRRVDEDYDVPLPGRCPHCHAAGTVVDQEVAEQYQTDIPPVRPITRRFRVHVGRCSCCGRRVQGRHRLQTSDALGAASVQIGPNALALAAQMNKELGVAYGKIVVFFATAFSLVVSRATWCRANMRLAGKARPTFNAMVLAVRHAVVVYADETGWKIAGLPAWLWAFVTAEITVYVIRRSRGFDVIEEILTAEYAGTLGRDGWAPYRKLENCLHQSCLGHVRVRCRKMLDVAVAGEARYPLAVRGVVKDAVALRDRRDGMSAHGFAVALGRLEARADRLLESRLTHGPNVRLQPTSMSSREVRPCREASQERTRRALHVSAPSGGGADGLAGRAGDPSGCGEPEDVGREPVGLRERRAGDPHERVPHGARAGARSGGALHEAPPLAAADRPGARAGEEGPRAAPAAPARSTHAGSGLTR